MAFGSVSTLILCIRCSGTSVKKPFVAFPLSEARHGSCRLRRSYRSGAKKQWRKLISSPLQFSLVKKQWGAIVDRWTAGGGGERVSGAPLPHSGKSWYNYSLPPHGPGWVSLRGYPTREVTLEQLGFELWGSIEKYLPADFKPVLFKGQLYM